MLWASLRSLDAAPIAREREPNIANAGTTPPADKGTTRLGHLTPVGGSVSMVGKGHGNR